MAPEEALRTDPARTSRPEARRSRLRRAGAAVVHRWPTLVALAWAITTLSDLDDGTEFAFVLVLAAVGYLAVTVLQRPRATWPLLVVLIVAVVALRVLGVDERAVMLALGGVLLLVGLVQGSLRRPGPPRLQVPGALVFVGVGILGTTVSPDVGLYIVAAGLLAHAAWDLYHWQQDRIVVRSFAEWCGVLDLTLGVGILVLLA